MRGVKTLSLHLKHGKKTVTGGGWRFESATHTVPRLKTMRLRQEAERRVGGLRDSRLC